MSTQGVRAQGVRMCRRRKVVMELDLNRAPPSENQDQVGTSTTVEPQVVQVNLQPISAPTPMIDVEAIDDDVVESSPRAFAEAKSNARRNPRRRIVDIDLEGSTRSRKRRRDSQTEPINGDHYINLESSSSSKKESEKQLPLKEPTFNCPICMGPFVEEMSTKCGHIFCKKCIKAAISAQGKCPTCRKKVTVKELIRVFLPAAF